MLKVNNKNTRMTSRCRSGIVIVNFGRSSRLFLVFLLLILSKSVFAGKLIRILSDKLNDLK